MKKIHIIVLSMILVLAYNCKDGKKTEKESNAATDEAVEKTAEEAKVEVIKFSMEPKSDSNVQGEVVFTEENGMVMMKATLSGLSPGEHAIHIHEKADCSSDDGTSSGGHWNPTHEPHGKWGMAEGYHKGDIGNFTADAEGNAVVEFSTDQWCIGCEDENMNILGKAVIVHQGVDDFTSQPSGAAGARVSCTGIIQ
ncbi:superoxide dismutase family protein [uncultured Eudoraea sp.]|jgi:Cu-Zn family superoxide dismutase|uniref:superoxide dismutase family protein n=1 Tax=uncultured Eudoraea sp. TaxID=1035614 RepID=UPI002624FB32|nr:superoxide dismutase family protein [uncultured Eudoraea sp.]